MIARLIYESVFVRCASLGFILALSGCSTARANDVYIAQSAAGAGNGTNCANAYPMTFFNTSGNWSSTPGSGPIGPGTTVHLCGTFNGQAGADGLLQVQRSGISGSPITIMAEPGLLMQAPYWGGGGAIQARGVSWIVINGANNGTIQATANGTRLANQGPPSCNSDNCAAGIALEQCDNCTVQNWTVQNMYINVPPNDENPSGEGNVGIFFNGGNNITISGNTVHDAKWCIKYGFFPTTTTQGVNIFANTVYNCDHGIAVFSDNSGATLNNLMVFGNTIHDAVNWDDQANNNHHDGIHISPTHPNTQVNHVQVYSNYIYGDWGANCNAMMYLEANPGNITDTQVFNNLIVNKSTSHVCANGLIQDFQNQNTLIANNTLVGSSTGAGQGIIVEEVNPYRTTVRNNVVNNLQNAFYVGQGNTFPVSDNNNFYNNANLALVWGSNCCDKLSAWQVQSGSQDTHSTLENPNLNANYTLGGGSPAIKTGANLTSLGIAKLNFDKSNTARPSSGAWDVGAYQFGGNKPNPPRSIAVIVH